MSGAARAFELYRQLINTHDFDVLEEQVLDSSITCVFSNAVHRGLAAVRIEFEQAWRELPDEVYHMTDPEWIYEGPEAALAIFRYQFEGTGLDGQTIRGSGCGTHVFRQTSRGWRLVYEHLSADAPANREDA